MSLTEKVHQDFIDLLNKSKAEDSKKYLLAHYKEPLTFDQKKFCIKTVMANSEAIHALLAGVGAHQDDDTGEILDLAGVICHSGSVPSLFKTLVAELKQDEPSTNSSRPATRKSTGGKRSPARPRPATNLGSPFTNRTICSSSYILFAAMFHYSNAKSEMLEAEAVKGVFEDMADIYGQIEAAVSSLRSLLNKGLEPVEFKKSGMVRHTAEGGFGVVYKVKAVVDEAERLYALKLLKIDAHTDSDEIQREVQLQCNLKGHPGIVALDSYEFSERYSWILLDWVEGGDMEHWSKHNHPGDIEYWVLSRPQRAKIGAGDVEKEKQRREDAFGENGFNAEESATEFLVAILPALVHCWLNRTHHGDLKPNNIMLCGGSTCFPMVADFGEGRLVQSWDGQRKTLCGTPGYRDPNVTGNQTYDAFLGDIHALGWVVVALIVGVFKFENHVIDKNGSIEDVWNWLEECNLSKGLQDLLKSMTDTDPMNRPSLFEIYSHPVLETARSKLADSEIYQSNVVKQNMTQLIWIGSKDQKIFQLSAESNSASIDRIVAEKEKEIARLKSEKEQAIAEKDKEIAGLKSEKDRAIAEKDKEIARVTEKNKEIEQLKEALQRKERTSDTNADLGVALAVSLDEEAGEEDGFETYWTRLYNTLHSSFRDFESEDLKYENISLPKTRQEFALLSNEQIKVFLAAKACAACAKNEKFPLPVSQHTVDRNEYFRAHIVRIAHHLFVIRDAKSKHVKNAFNNASQKHSNLSTRFEGGVDDVKPDVESLLHIVLKKVYKDVAKTTSLQSRGEMETMFREAFEHGIFETLGDIPLEPWEDWKLWVKIIGKMYWDVYSA